MGPIRSIFLLISVLGFAIPTNAQINDVSSVTGLPIPIGASVIYGQVLIHNVPRSVRRPTVFVYIRNGGAEVAKYQANDSGYWYFLRQPVDGHTITFEVDGIEVGRSIIASGGSNRFRQDVELDYNALKGVLNGRTLKGVVSARDRYQRSSDADNEYEAALIAIRDKPEEALRLFLAIVAKDANDHNAWLQIGALHHNASRFGEARKAYTRALELEPRYLAGHINLGKLELGQKNYESAISAFSKAAEVEPDSAEAHYLLGETYLQDKKGSLAVGQLNKAIELDPVGKADAHLRLAALYNAAGYKDRAALEYKAFLGKIKDHPDKKKLEEYIKTNLPDQK